MDLEEFIKLEAERIKLFAEWYSKQNLSNPEHYPLSLPDENSGLWNEMLQDFDPDDPIYQ